MRSRPPPPDVLTGPELDAPAFPTATCDALFAAVLIDDEIDPHTELPPVIQLDFPQEQLVECFRLSRQLWKTGFEREALIDLTDALRRDRDLGDADRRQFKHIRAKFKHFRYAHALYGAAHRYPAMLDRVTITMGQVQDAVRNGHRAAHLRRVALLRLLLSGVPMHLLHRGADRLHPADSASFRRLLETDAATLGAMLVKDPLSGPEFHAARKIVGRQVSFWDTLRTLAPAADRDRMSRSLSAINGLMGQLHDGLVERKAIDANAYRTAFVLPAAIRDRLADLVDRYRSSGAAAP